MFNCYWSCKIGRSIVGQELTNDTTNFLIILWFYCKSNRKEILVENKEKCGRIRMKWLLSNFPTNSEQLTMIKRSKWMSPSSMAADIDFQHNFISFFILFYFFWISSNICVFFLHILSRLPRWSKWNTQGKQYTNQNSNHRIKLIFLMTQISIRF